MSIAALRQKAQELMKEAAEASRQLPEGWPSLFFYDSDTSHYITPLHGWEYHIPVIKHVEKVNKRYLTRICNSMFGKPCKDCENNVDKGTDFCIVGYVHTLEGVTREIQSGKRAGEQIELEPFRVIPIRGGKGQANLTEIVDAHRGGYFHKKIWQIKKTGSGTDTTYLPPIIVQSEKLGPDFDPTVPDYVRAAMVPPKGMTEEQLIAAFILANYGNNEDAFAVVGLPTLTEVVKMVGSRAKVAVNPSSKLK